MRDGDARRREIARQRHAGRVQRRLRHAVAVVAARPVVGDRSHAAGDEGDLAAAAQVPAQRRDHAQGRERVDLELRAHVVEAASSRPSSRRMPALQTSSSSATPARRRASAATASSDVTSTPASTRTPSASSAGDDFRHTADHLRARAPSAGGRAPARCPDSPRSPVQSRHGRSLASAAACPSARPVRGPPDRARWRPASRPASSEPPSCPPPASCSPRCPACPVRRRRASAGPRW